jgi:pSer/pThr/pTyr-binding forkhead associated (FHA) protein
MQLPLKMFCSYASEDSESLKAFLPYMKTLERGGLATIWYDGMLAPGSAWNPGIEAALTEARVIVLLISADFIGSDYCMTVELPRALERQAADDAVVIPVLIRPTPLNAGLAVVERQIIPRGLKPVSTWTNRDDAWTAVTNEIVTAIKAFADRHATPWDGAGAARRILLEFRAVPTRILCVFDESAEIGRSHDCDIALARAPGDVGKLHARFRYRPRTKSFLIEDLDSENGTFVDKIRVKASAPLRTGAQVQLGGRLTFTFMQYRREGRATGALVYSDGDTELGRYLLVPSNRVGVGTTSGDAVRIPREDDGLAAGFLEVTNGHAQFHSSTDDEESSIVDLRNGEQLQVLSRMMRVKILQ